MHSDREQPIWRDEQFNIGAGVVAYRRHGTGPGVLYLHDAGAHTLSSPAFADLARDHEVVVADLPGYGDSTPPLAWVDTAEVAAWCGALLDHLAWPTAVIAGTSLGGWFALELALAHPERVSALVLADSAGLHDPQDFLLDLFVAADEHRDAQTRIAQAIWNRLPQAEQVTVDSAVGSAVWGPWLAPMAAAAWCAWHPYTANPRMLALLGRIRCPVHLLWGAHDTLIPLAHGQAMAAALPNAVFEVVPDAGHLVAMDAPQHFAAAVRRVSELST